ncbi:MAG: site-specific DNA-methyltransferase [Candidatus Dormibacteraceae bacterium]
MKPYYDEGGITIYHGDCREILTGVITAEVDLVLTDPPYGVSERTDRKAKGRGKLAECKDFPPVYGDDEPFDPTHLLTFKRVVMFGANHYSSRLPVSPSWFVWDKREGIPSNDNADCELAWSNLGGPARLYHHRWNGMIKATEGGDQRIHPTQKPISLMSWLIDRNTKPGDLVLDPYLGGGSTLIAAKRCGRKAIGIEIEERYCEIAAKRLAQGALDFDAAPVEEIVQQGLAL